MLKGALSLDRKHWEKYTKKIVLGKKIHGVGKVRVYLKI